MKHLFIVGAQRSGSTYLYHLLDDHPQVSMAHPVRPEPKFFLNEQSVAKGISYYEQTCFADQKEGSLYLGEKSTSYIERQDSARRIRDFYPDARILMVLRDPVLRAYSNYRFSVTHGLEKLTFAEALLAESDRLETAEFSTSVSPFAYRKRGNYNNYVEAYLQVFDADQISILIFEELVNNLQGVQGLYKWLDIDVAIVPPSLSKVINPGNSPAEDQGAVFRDLVAGYQDSIEWLELHLGRPVTVWRENHCRILTGAA